MLSPIVMRAKKRPGAGRAPVHKRQEPELEEAERVSPAERTAVKAGSKSPTSSRAAEREEEEEEEEDHEELG